MHPGKRLPCRASDRFQREIMSNDETPMTGERMLDRLVTLACEKRGEDLVALDVRELVEYMDYLLVVTARSERQNRAIAENLIRGMKQEGILPLSRAGIDVGNWICIDFVDVVVHLFTPDTRAIYDLELLWADAPVRELKLPEHMAEESPLER